jgi:hypothetical protein
MAPRTKKAAEAKADAQDDVSMTDAPAVQPGAADETYLEVEEQWIRIVGLSTPALVGGVLRKTG